MTREAPHLLDQADIDARSRLRAILVVWIWELACGLLLATPVHSWAMRAWGSHPDGDAPLFAPGAHALLTWLGDPGPALGIVTRTSLVGFVVGALLGQLVLGALVAALATGRGEQARAPDTAFTLGVGARTFLPLLTIAVVFVSLQGAVLGIGLLASSAVDHALQPSLGDAQAFAARLGALVPFALLVLLLGVIEDLARVALVRDAVTPSEELPSTFQAVRRALVAGFRTAFRAPSRASFGWGWRAVISVALLFVAARAGDLVGARGGTTLWLLFGAHQLIAIARVSLRAGWLANALRLVAGTTSAPNAL